jgi:phage shock protein PspC (stress-responsive transcriptional regulator)
MNKVFNINLGGVPFTIDQDAYEELSQYLEIIHNHFRHTEGYQEITNDIEARMAELFQEKLGGRPIVTVSEVRSVIAIMGTPEDFGAEAAEAEAPKSAWSGNGKWKLKTGRRLFRNVDETVIGGVCSGIAAYFGIQDPLWVRLAFILFAITGGFAIPLYIILWGVLPKAETASDRLAMRGEPANVENISKIIQEEFEHVSKKVSELGDELKAEFGSKKKSAPPSDGSESQSGFTDGGHHFRAAATEGIHVLGTVVLAILDVLKKIIKPVAFVIGIMMVVFLALIWIASVGGLFWGLPFSSFLFPGTPFITTLGVINVLVLIGIPILMMILLVMRIFMRTHFKPRWAAGLWIFWLINVFSFAFLMGTMGVKQFSTGGEVSMGAKDLTFSGDTLFIDIAENPYNDVIFRMGDNLAMTDDRLISNDVVLNFEKSKTGRFELLQKNRARGGTLSEAQTLAQDVEFPYELKGNHLVLPANFIIPKGVKWRNQEVELTLRVPVDKWVKVPDNDFNLRNIETDSRYEFPWWDHSYAWKMTADGMVAPDYSKSKQRDYNFTDFSKVSLKGKVKLNLLQGDHYEIRFHEGLEHEDEVEIDQQGTWLNIATDADYGDAIVIDVLMPDLVEVDLEWTGDVYIRDFKLDKLRIVNHGDAQVKAFVEVGELTVDLKANNELDVRGSGTTLIAILDEEARLNAEHYEVKVADIEATGNSWVKVSATDTLRQRIEQSELTTKRNPVIINQ